MVSNLHLNIYWLISLFKTFCKLIFFVCGVLFYFFIWLVQKIKKWTKSWKPWEATFTTHFLLSSSLWTPNPEFFYCTVAISAETYSFLLGDYENFGNMNEQGWNKEPRVNTQWSLWAALVITIHGAAGTESVLKVSSL